MRIAAIANADDVVAEVARLNSSGTPALLAFYVSQDEKQSDRYAAHLRQSGLGLPERDYYLGTSDDSKRIRAEYRDHVAAMLRLLGDSPEAASRAADAVLTIETRLATASRTPVQLRDREAQYNKKTLSELAALAPKVSWNVYLKTIDATGSGRRDRRPT